MKRKSYFSFLIGRLLIGIVIGAVIFALFKSYLHLSYDDSLEKGQDFIFEKYEQLLKKYDEGELDETFINICCNLYTADYIKFAKVNEDGSFDTVFETDYNSVPLEKNSREWICLTDDEELLAKGKSTVTINDDWTIYYKTCDEIGSLNYNDRNRNYYVGNSWTAAELSNYGRGQALFVACVISSGALQYRIPVIETYYEDQNTFHIGKVHLEDYDYRRYSSDQSWDFTDPSKADLYSTNIYNENTDFGDMYRLVLRCDRPDAFFGQNGDIFLANSMSDLEKFDRETDGRIRKQYGEIFSARAGMRNNGYYTMGRLAVIEINGQKYLVESVSTTLNYKDYFKPVFLIAGIVLLVFSIGIPCLTAVRPYSEYKKAYENNRFKNSLIDSLAHNLKTPLQILGGYAENLKDVSDASEKDRYADRILTKTQEMNADIELILKTADKTSLRFSKTSIRKCLEEVASKAGAGIDIKGDAEYMTERDYFNTALFCLVDNAVKYGNKDAKIEAAITSKSITIRNKTTAGKFTPGTGIAIAGRIFEQHKLKLTTDLKDGVFEARITKK